MFRPTSRARIQYSAHKTQTDTSAQFRTHRTQTRSIKKGMFRPLPRSRLHSLFASHLEDSQPPSRTGTDTGPRSARHSAQSPTSDRRGTPSSGAARSGASGRRPSARGRSGASSRPSLFEPAGVLTRVRASRAFPTTWRLEFPEMPGPRGRPALNTGAQRLQLWDGALSTCSAQVERRPLDRTAFARGYSCSFLFYRAQVPLVPRESRVLFLTVQ